MCVGNVPLPLIAAVTLSTGINETIESDETVQEW
jgi:hypothetical protein